MKTILTTSALALLLALPAAAATIVQNGSFESGPAGAGLNGDSFGTLPGGSGNASWDIWTAIPGWMGTAGDGIEIQTANTLGQIDPQDGAYYVELDSNNNSAMKQSVYLTVGQYLLSFWYSPREDNVASNGIAYGITGLFADSVAGPGADPLTQVGSWTNIVKRFSVTSDGSYDLTFAAFGTQGDHVSYGGLIDNVSLAAVPVPAAGLLMLAGLGALGAAARRRRP